MKKYNKPVDQCTDCKFSGITDNKVFCDKESGDLARYGPTETKFCGYFKEKVDCAKKS